MRHRKNKDYFKIIVIIIGIIILSFIFFKGCRSIADDLSDAFGKSAQVLYISSGMYDDAPAELTSSSYTHDLVMSPMLTSMEYYNDMYIDLTENGTGPEYTPKKTDEPVNAPEPESETTPEDTSSDINMNEEDSIMAAASKVYNEHDLLDYNFVLKNFYIVPSHTELKEDILDLNKIVNTDITIKKDASKPQILIFHTHSQENFADFNENGKTIVDAGTYLTDLLTEKYGYNVIHLTDKFDMMDGKLDRGKAYTYANTKLDEVLSENPSVQVVIDLHRDGIDPNRHLVTDINGKQTAKVMLFNGISYTKELGNIDYLNNPYLTENLAMTYRMFLLGKIMYPDFFRCIYIEGYRYCLYHAGRSMLIEAGAQTNTYQEVYNAMEPIAEMLDIELSKK